MGPSCIFGLLLPIPNDLGPARVFFRNILTEPEEWPELPDWRFPHAKFPAPTMLVKYDET